MGAGCSNHRRYCGDYYYKTYPDSQESLVVQFSIAGRLVEYKLPVLVSTLPIEPTPPTAPADFLVNVTFSFETGRDGLVGTAAWQTYEISDFIYEYRQVGTIAWTGTLRPGEMPSVPLYNLKYDTAYEFRIKLVDNSLQRNVTKVSQIYTFFTPKQ